VSAVAFSKPNRIFFNASALSKFDFQEFLNICYGKFNKKKNQKEVYTEEILISN
jgi:hypothetical protein